MQMILKSIGCFEHDFHDKLVRILFRTGTELFRNFKSHFREFYAASLGLRGAYFPVDWAFSFSFFIK